MTKFGHWILISGSGIGAGKTTLARKFPGASVMSLAGALRDDLAELHPDVNWHDRSQEYKNSRPESLGGLSVREKLVQFGQERCFLEKTYWPRRLMERMSWGAWPSHTFVVDDLRKTVELDYFRQQGKSVLHLHIHHETAIPEPQYDSDALFDVADYVIMRRRE